MITLFIGFMANILVITNDILGIDAIAFSDIYIANNWDLSLGRWLLKYIDYTRFGLSSSVVSGIFAISILSISSLLLIDLFEIKNKFFKYLISILLVVSPFFTETLYSFFCSFEFTLSFMLAILSVFLIYKLKNKNIRIIISSLCIACSLGLYQSFIGVTCGLCILVPLIRLLKNEMTPKKFLQKFVESLIIGILAIIVYEIILNLLLMFAGISLSDYSGANSIGLNNFKNIVFLIKDSLKSFYSYFLTNKIINNLIYKRNIVNIIITFLTLIIIIKKILENKNKTNILFILEIILCLILTPVALGIIEIIAPARDINQLMSAPYILIYIFVVALLDNEKFKGIYKFSGGVLVLLTIFIIDSYFVMANASSMAVRITKERTLFATKRIINKIYETEGYNDNMKVLFIGNSSGKYFKSSNEVYKLSSGPATTMPLTYEKPDLCNRDYHNLIKYYLGIEFVRADINDYSKVIKTEEFKNMNTYPYNNFTKVIGDILVVKIKEIEN